MTFGDRGDGKDGDDSGGKMIMMVDCAGPDDKPVARCKFPHERDNISCTPIERLGTVSHRTPFGPSSLVPIDCRGRGGFIYPFPNTIVKLRRAGLLVLRRNGYIRY